MSPDLPRPLATLAAWRPSLQPLTLALFASLFFTVTANGRFLSEMYAHATAGGPLFFVAMTALAITAFHFILLALLLNRWTARPLLSVLIVLTAATVYFMRKYGVYMDVSMLRNVLETDTAEVRDLLAADLLPHMLLYALLPVIVLWRVRITPRPLRRSLQVRAVAMLAALLVAAGAVALVSRELVPLMREHKELRYLVTPGNYLSGFARIARGSGGNAVKARQALGEDARHRARTGRPTLLMLVIGETARAANWGLDGYTRQTTPELAALGVINFPQVDSCGTNTETSLPCMFSPMGRGHYDEDVARNSESLLHVLTHAGLRVIWRDNQSGCKGVCDGLPVDVLTNAHVPGLCNDTHCLDEVLLHGLEQEIAATPGDLVIVLHQVGNHGPAYFQRYPPSFRRYTPTCDTTDLGACTQEAIINTYDNGILYTDHVLAKTVALLQREAPTHDTILLYVSDHGESLGENGLYLHSIPRAIAPDTQTHVPMVMWLSDAYSTAERVDIDCLRQRAQAPASHDNLFHTVLGIMDVDAALHDRSLDLLAPCRVAR